jgi:3-methylcrotonyl-CoA carboxylase alpha subunit
MFSSALIANRGEIACRVARTARRMGMRVIAVYSTADRNALHVRLADEAYEIGPAPARESYLVIDRLIETARKAGAQCIHPGYGFLSENAAFAEACALADIAFVGPSAYAIRSMGLKDRAKTLMEKAGVPVVPGYHGERQEAPFLAQQAAAIGFPVLIKAAAGGGGKGMRRVDEPAAFAAALAGAQREAHSAFGNERVLIEKYIASPRHIEMQIFADMHGNTIHLNERDCSLQRRHQKVIEEAPAPGMSASLRVEMGDAAVRTAKAVGYAGAGTVEFIADGEKGLRSGFYWFMEMNTRLQVEHPVTEAITGLDLVEWQFRIAAGERLPLTQAEVPLNGHAVEARIYAEDPARNFLPSTGEIIALEFPANVRVDSGVEAGGEIPSHYDPLIAKMIAHAPTRTEALARLGDALDQTIVAGPRNNVAFLSALTRADEFRAGRFDTRFIERHINTLTPHGFDPAAAAFGAAHILRRETARIAQTLDRDDNAPVSPWDASDGFQLTGERLLEVHLSVDGEVARAAVKFRAGGVTVTVDGVPPALDARAVEAADGVHVLRKGRQTIVRRVEFSADELLHADGDGNVRAPMHGKVLEVFVSADERVARGQRLATIEAMKMEHTLAAPCAGRVAAIAVAVGAQVAEGAQVMTIEPTEGLD